MRQEQQGLPARSITAQSDVDRAAPRDGLDDLRLQARGSQHRRDPSSRDQFAIRCVRWDRIDGPDPDELLQRLHEFAGGRFPGGGVQTIGWCRSADGHDRLPVTTARRMPSTKPPRTSPMTMAMSSLP